MGKIKKQDNRKIGKLLVKRKKQELDEGRDKHKEGRSERKREIERKTEKL
jgi:hypothetical protein